MGGNKLKNRNKRADTDSIHNQPVETNSMQDLTEENLLKKVYDFETEGENVNKLKWKRTPSILVKI